MGCDIHIVVEVKKNGKWEYVPEVPENFDQRNYGVFAALADVRNSFNIKGFKPKGLPEDISARKFGFKSYTENATKRFYSDDDGRIMFIAEDGTVKDLDVVNQNFSKYKGKEIITYCGSAIEAAINFILLDELGYNAKMYVGSMSDYISYDDNIVEK